MGRSHVQDRYRSALRRAQSIPGFDVCIRHEYAKLSSEKHLIIVRTKNGKRVFRAGSVESAGMISDHMRAYFEIQDHDGSRILKPRGVGVRPGMSAEIECWNTASEQKQEAAVFSKMFSQRAANYIFSCSDVTFIFFWSMAKGFRRSGRFLVFDEELIIAGAREIEKSMKLSTSKELHRVPRKRALIDPSNSPLGSRMVNCSDVQTVVSTVLLNSLHGKSPVLDQKQRILSLFEAGDFDYHFRETDFNGFLEIDKTINEEWVFSALAAVETIGALGMPRAAKAIAEMVDADTRLSYEEWSRGFLKACVENPEMPTEMLVNMYKGHREQKRMFRKTNLQWFRW